MTGKFIITKEHRRFTEFANVVRKEHTIGICYGGLLSIQLTRWFRPRVRPVG